MTGAAIVLGLLAERLRPWTGPVADALSFWASVGIAWAWPGSAALALVVAVAVRLDADELDGAP